MSIRTVLGAGLASLLLAACGAGDRQDAEPPAASDAPAPEAQDGRWNERAPEPWIDRPASAGAAPLAFAAKTTEADLELGLDRQIARWPALHGGVYDREVRLMRRFERMTAEEKARERTAGADAAYVFVREADWSVAASTPRLVSLRGEWYEDVDAAHPYSGFDVMLWDVDAGKPTEASALFRPGDDAGIDTALCDALAKAKAERKVQNWDRSKCPKWRSAELVLAPSTVSGKVGGVTLLFEPYAAGSYSEGQYVFTLPQSLFRPVLAPGWAGEFGGEPKT